MMARGDTHAIVIGGSMAGLLAARALSDHFAKVTLIERDRFPETAVPRKGVPQGRHIHGLLGGGLQALTHLFPDLEESLISEGAASGDYLNDVYWHQFGRYRARFQSGIRGIVMTRPFLEWHVRRRVLGLPNLTGRQDCSVEGLLSNNDRTRIIGVILQDHANGKHTEQLTADLIVDTSGRGSRSPQWLEALGYPRPDESVLKIDVGYASRMYRRRHSTIGGQAFTLFVLPQPPDLKRGAGLFPVEGERWLLTLAGYLNDHPPTDESGFLAFARSLATSDVYELIRDAEPLSEIVTYKYRANQRRHYEKLTRFPEGYLVLGDAICSFNPIYGQGMTVSAQEALALQGCLNEWRSAGTLDGIAPRFFRQATPIIDAAWMQATGEDLRFPEVDGPRPPATAALLGYTNQVQQAAMDDATVCRALAKVVNLMEPPASLLHPRVALRILGNVTGTQQVTHKPAAGPPLQPSYLHHYVDLDQVRLHYVELGNGPLVVLLHGFPEFWYSWRYQIPALAAAGFRVVAPDMRGYNLSAKPAGVAAYSGKHLTADVANLIRRLGAERATVVGHDWGGAVAWLFAMRYGEMLDRLVIMNAPHPARFREALRSWPQLRKSWYMFFFQLPWLPEALARAGNYAGLHRTLRADPVRPDAFDKEDIERYVAAAAQPGALTASINYYRALFRSGARQPGAAPPRIDTPTLVIWGEQDRYLGSELAAPDRNLVPNIRVERIPNASHWVQIDRPRQVNELLLGFLTGGNRSP
jgi:pimeloyl-ACP methyl ester carboxylesterase/2-polyprenyl-6-methoxyphenol hydroxylase-like FAD-dependent oxidoreductase